MLKDVREGAFRLKKSKWMIPLSAVMMMGLAGCGTNRAGVDNQNKSNARPMGYYSNENHPNRSNGFLTDNDGPMTEMMDHTLGEEGRTTSKQNRRALQTRNSNGNPSNPTKPLATNDRNFFQRDNRFSTSDVNYHGHLNQNIGNTGMATDPNYQDSASDQIRKKAATVKNVQDVRSVSLGNSVVVSVNLIDKRKAAETKKAIRNVVQPYANGRSVTVITDEGTFGRDRNYNNDIQQGGAR